MKHGVAGGSRVRMTLNGTGSDSVLRFDLGDVQALCNDVLADRFIRLIRDTKSENRVLRLKYYREQLLSRGRVTRIPPHIQERVVNSATAAEQRHARRLINPLVSCFFSLSRYKVAWSIPCTTHSFGEEFVNGLDTDHQVSTGLGRCSELA